MEWSDKIQLINIIWFGHFILVRDSRKIYGENCSAPPYQAAIRIGNPASWKRAEAARDESGGLIDTVTDEEILTAQKRLAEEGVFVEPASAASLAGLEKLGRQGYFDDFIGNPTVVATVTGHGLKDPDTAIRQSVKPTSVDADIQSVITAIADLLEE